MRLIKPGPDREVPRGIVGGAEISQTTADALNIYMGRFRVPAGARSRPHYHEGCESALYMLTGSVRILWGDRLEQQPLSSPGTCSTCPPRVTHVVENVSDSEAGGLRCGAGLAAGGPVVVPWAEEQL